MTDRKLFVFGDNLQEGKAVDISYLQAIQSPTIEYSMRSGWTTTKENADKFRVLTKTINDLDYNVDTRSQIISEFNSIIDSESFTVKYGYDKQGLLVGHKFEENINNVRQFLE
jgi:YD repeat-containing protein